MTTKDSPIHILREQADKTAAILKAAERGDPIDVPYAAAIVAARERETVKFAMAMDDKILKIEMPWQMIRETDEAGIAEFIVNEMQEKKDTIQ